MSFCNKIILKLLSKDGQLNYFEWIMLYQFMNVKKVFQDGDMYVRFLCHTFPFTRNCGASFDLIKKMLFSSLKKTGIFIRKF